MLKLFLALLSVCCTFLVSADHNVHGHTNGTSGVRCGAHKCLDSVASCQDGKCKCQSPLSKGIGSFLCVDPSDYFCAILNDPMVIGFDGSKTNVPLINKFYMTYLVTGTCANSQPTNGTCTIFLSAWAGRIRGKTFIKGYELYVYVDYQDTSYDETFKLSTSAINGIYTYWEFEASLTIPGHTPITTLYDDVNNFARLNMEACGVEVGIRGAEQVEDPLLLPAGIYITVSTGCGTQPSFPGTFTYLCSPPPGQGITLDQQVDVVSVDVGRNVSREMLSLYKSLIATLPFQGSPASLHSLIATIISCDYAPAFDALKQCYFIIDDPRFFKCYDRTDDGDEAVQLMDACCSAVCDKRPMACLNVKNVILNSGCTGGIRSPQNTILNSTCEFKN